jgi:hypothetical protein
MKISKAAALLFGKIIKIGMMIASIGTVKPLMRTVESIIYYYRIVTYTC